MRILWVKAGGLVPPDTGGKIRSYNILRELASKHDVTLFTFYPAHANDAHADLSRIFNRVVYWPLKISPPKSLAGLMSYGLNLFSSYPHGMAKYYRPDLSRGLREIVATNAFDLIVCDFLVPAGIIPWDLPGLKVIFTHNVEAMIWQRHYRLARNLAWKAVCWREYRAMARAERLFLEKADHVLSVSEADRDVFAQYLEPSKITVIPTGVDVDYFRPTLGAEEQDQLVFTGSMDWMANEDGVLYFVDLILPLIRQRVPNVSLWVVGRRPSVHLRALAAKDRAIRVTGSVEDIRPFVSNASVYVVPIRVGSGTRIKIFEAMAMGKAVVSTSIGAEGLPVQDGKNIWLADEPEQFANAVVALLQSSETRAKLGRAARTLVEREHSWAMVAAHFDSVLNGLIGKASEDSPEFRRASLGEGRAE